MSTQRQFRPSRQSVSSSKRPVLGMGHPWTRIALRGLALAYGGLDRGDDAPPLWREFHEFQLGQVEDPDASAQVLNEAASDLLTNGTRSCVTPPGRCRWLSKPWTRPAASIPASSTHSPWLSS